MPSIDVGFYAALDNPGENGGLEGVIMGLIAALGRLDDDDERYTIIGSAQHPEWVKPYLGTNQRLVLRGAHSRSLRSRVKARIKSSSRRGKDQMNARFLESLGCDVLHFPFQYFETTSTPSVYTPHDLQHIHYPQFFSEEELILREETYRRGCDLARIITVGSQWVKEDIVDNYPVPAEKIEVIPLAPPTQIYPPLSAEEEQAAVEQLGLAEDFVLYPAVTWPHKNHLRLVEALALLRDEHEIDLKLVCSGHQTPHLSDILARVRLLGLERRVRFVGMIPGSQLRALYRKAGFVFIPTLFEAGSGPMVEAWLEGTPVACSNVTSLPEQAGGAALLFDPLSVEEIAKALATMHKDGELRKRLVQKGTERLRAFNWSRTAQAYRDVYRRAAEI